MPEDFNGTTYISLYNRPGYPGMQQAAAILTPKQLEAFGRKHYAHHGREEKRHYLPEDFNGKTYVSLYNRPGYPGMQRAATTLTPEQLKAFGRKHYAHHDREEGRHYLPEDFITQQLIFLYILTL